MSVGHPVMTFMKRKKGHLETSLTRLSPKTSTLLIPLYLANTYYGTLLLSKKHHFRKFRTKKF